MKTKNFALILTPMLGSLCAMNAYAGDGFEAVRCGADIPKALIGRKSSNDTTMAFEARHKDLGLKHLGADEISDRLNAINWLICGEEYVVLEDGDVIKDVIKMPKHSKEQPEFSGACQLNGKDLPGFAIGVLKNEEGVQMLSAVAAWKIDEKQKKFIPLQIDGLRCSRDGIITVDGGK